MPIRLQLLESGGQEALAKGNDRPWFRVLAAGLRELGVEVMRTRWGKVALLAPVAVLAVLMAGCLLFFLGLTHVVVSQDQWEGNPALLFADSQTLYLGERATVDEIEASLRAAGISTERSNPAGYFRRTGHSIEIHPGVRYRPALRPARIHIEDGRVKSIHTLYDYSRQHSYRLAPPLIAPYFDEDRTKRRAVRFDQIPIQLRNAILAVEDHRFYEHGGVDVARTVRAAYDGLSEWRTPRGTSTLTQQLARELFLTKKRSYERKIQEAAIAFQLERRLPKQRILEYYCNHVTMGSHASFHVVGFAEAANLYLGKDLWEVTLGEAALLAGLPQRPNYLHPLRHPERATQRRDVVLGLMLRHNFITPGEYGEATAEPFEPRSLDVDIVEAPYFLDLVRQQLDDELERAGLESEGYRVFTTLDGRLQHEAVTALSKGLEQIDSRIAKQKRFAGKEPPRAQAALVALDPTTGDVKALVGGRDYAESQLNRALAQRQPGSAFKPFVYAAAINTGLNRDGYPVTAASTVLDEETVFMTAENEEYVPSNFSGETHGIVTLRQALRRSINIATVRLAEHVGYEEIAALAGRAGMGDSIQPTPAMALGAYEVSPLQLASAYTAFANAGVMARPTLIRTVQDAGGKTLLRDEPEWTRVMDRRVAAIVTDMMEDVVNRGTASRARALGFNEPAAGKTGTDDDGWFVGFTSNLLCVVWVGFDDNSDLKITGSKSAVPIWAEFMKSAHELEPYRDPLPFQLAPGVLEVSIDAETGLLAGPHCPKTIEEVFIAGTEPTRPCHEHDRGLWKRTSRLFRYRH